MRSALLLLGECAPCCKCRKIYSALMLLLRLNDSIYFPKSRFELLGVWSASRGRMEKWHPAVHIRVGIGCERRLSKRQQKIDNLSSCIITRPPLKCTAVAIFLFFYCSFRCPDGNTLPESSRHALSREVVRSFVTIVFPWIVHLDGKWRVRWSEYQWDVRLSFWICLDFVDSFTLNLPVLGGAHLCSPKIRALLCFSVYKYSFEYLNACFRECDRIELLLE